jgi:hypothetical protein
VDQQLKGRMKELGEAINTSLADSESIAGAVGRIKEGGYDIFLVLEATIGVSKQGEKMSDETSVVWPPESQPPFNLRIGEHVRVGPLKPDGAPNPSAGKTGRVRKLLQLDDRLRAVVEADNDFIVVSAESLEALP